MESHNRVEIDKGNVFYYLDDKFHRINDPAIIWSNGSKEWLQNGKFHRTDGPACEWYDGYREWFFNGKKINVSSQAEFERHLKFVILT